MPKKIHSKAQWAALFSKANHGEIPGGVAKVKEMAAGVRFSALPEHVKKRKVRRKVIGRDE